MHVHCSPELLQCVHLGCLSQAAGAAATASWWAERGAAALVLAIALMFEGWAVHCSPELLQCVHLGCLRQAAGAAATAS